jgi:chromosome segregation ATPase
MTRITEEQVHAACMEIATQGERPTALKLLDQLGSGSLTTITKYMGTWNETNQAQITKTETLPAVIKLPDELAKYGEDLLKKVWNFAKTMADKELEVHSEALKQAEASTHAKVEEAYKFSDAQSIKIEQLEDTLAAMKKDFNNVQRDLIQTRDKLNETEKLNVGVSKDNEHMALTVTELKLELKKARETEAAAEKLVANLEGQLKVYTALDKH